MNRKWALHAAFFFSFLIPLEVRGQATTEYGKQLEGLKERRPTVKQGPSRGPGTGSSRPVEVPQQSDLPPGKPLPSVLLVNRSDIPLYATQDEQSDTGVKLGQGESLTPLGQTYHRGEPWFMVRTKTGTIGWVRSSDVKEATKK